MKFKCERDTLIAALAKAERAATKKGHLVNLSGVLVEISDDNLTVTGTDTELTIAARVKVNGQGDGAALVPARLILDVVRSLDLGAVELEAGEGTLQVTAGRSEFALDTMAEASDFPSVPRLSEATVTVDGPALVAALRQVVPAASSDEGRPVLTGVLVTSEGDGLRVVATDSYRLARRDVAGVDMNVGAKGVLVPSRALDEVRRLAGGDERVGVQLDSRIVSFEIGDTLLSARLINGDFPKYEGLIPTDHPNKLTVNREQLLGAIRRVRVLAADRTPIRIAQGAETVTLSVATQDVGKVTEEVVGNYEGDDLEIAFNADYLQDGVEVVDSEEVELLTATAGAPALLQAPGREDFLYLLMPVRV